MFRQDPLPKLTLICIKSLAALGRCAVLASLRAASRQLISKRSEFKTTSAHNAPAGQTPSVADRAFFRTRKRSIVTGPDCLLLNGSRSILPRPEVEKRTPSPSSTGKT